MSVPATQYTIDELARETGMTVRNIRAHQSRGLLPAPALQGRTGYYGREHVARLETIRELQGRGFNLEAIRQLIDAGGGEANADMLGFARIALEPFSSEQPEVVDATELVARLGGDVSREVTQRALALGIVRQREDGRFEIASPRLERAAEQLVASGVPLETVMDVGEQLQRHVESVADAFVALFVEHVWEPFQAAGHPDDRWPEVRRTLERLRPLTAESLLAVFGRAMTEAVDRALGEQLGRLGLDVAAPAADR